MHYIKQIWVVYEHLEQRPALLLSSAPCGTAVGDVTALNQLLIQWRHLLVCPRLKLAAIQSGLVQLLLGLLIETDCY